MATYSVTQSAVTQLLADVKGDRIAIPELQRPFVWDSIKVRDLMDSLYKGYPVGYLITWQSVGAKLKGGEVRQAPADPHRRPAAHHGAASGRGRAAGDQQEVQVCPHRHRLQPDHRGVRDPDAGHRQEPAVDLRHQHVLQLGVTAVLRPRVLGGEPRRRREGVRDEPRAAGGHQERPDRHHQPRRRPRRRDGVRDLHPHQLEGRSAQQRRLRDEQDRDLRRSRAQPAQAHRLLLPPGGRTPRLRRHQGQRPRVRRNALPQGDQLAARTSPRTSTTPSTATSSASPASSASAAARPRASSASSRGGTQRRTRSTRS